MPADLIPLWAQWVVTAAAAVYVSAMVWSVAFTIRQRLRRRRLLKDLANAHPGRIHFVPYPDPNPKDLN